MNHPAADDRTRNARAARWPGLLVGFGAGGMIDGVLLHQVLRWHHLLGGVPAARREGIGFQIFADGAFHALMLAAAAAGAVLAWRARGRLAGPSGGRALAGYALVGFGVWHVIDAVLVHWILGLHRIRMDVHDPLPWDLGWLAVFGLVPLALGIVILRAGRPS